MVTAQISLISILTLTGSMSHDYEMAPRMRTTILRQPLLCSNQGFLLPKHAICLQLEDQDDEDWEKLEDFSPAFDLANLVRVKRSDPQSGALQNCLSSTRVSQQTGYFMSLPNLL